MPRSYSTAEKQLHADFGLLGRWISSIDRLSSIKWGVRYRLMILGVVTYVLVVARTSTPTVPTALGVPYGYAPAVTRVLGPTIAMSVTILKL